MCRLKALIVAFLLTVCAGAPPALADGFPISPSQRATVFAVCAGAYAALAEHRALFDGSAAQAAWVRRAAFAQMLDAVSADAVAHGLPETRIAARRVQARADLRALLSAAEFNMMPERALAARSAARATLARCDALLLGS